MQQTIVGKLGQPMTLRMQDQGYDGHSRSFKWDDERLFNSSSILLFFISHNSESFFVRQINDLVHKRDFNIKTRKRQDHSAERGRLHNFDLIAN